MGKLLELLGKSSLEEFREQFDYVLDEMIAKDQAKRRLPWRVHISHAFSV